MTLELLDRIDPARHDVDAIIALLNEWDSLPEQEQEEHEDRVLYSGIDEAAHPLTALIGEAHNAFYAVRDLDGSLVFVCEEPTGPGAWRWEAGPLYRDHISELELEPYLEGEADPHDVGINLSAKELLELVDSLPPAPGPVVSY